MPIVTMDRVRQIGGIAADREQALEAALRSAVEWLESDQGAGLFVERRTGFVQRFDRHRVTSVILFPNLFPIESVSLVRELWDADEGWKTLTTADYEVVDKGTRQVRFNRIGGFWAPCVEVTMTGGYEANPEPGDGKYKTPESIAGPIVAQARFTLERSAGDRLVTSSVSLAGSQTTYLPGSVHPSMSDLAKSLRRFSFG